MENNNNDNYEDKLGTKNNNNNNMEEEKEQNPNNNNSESESEEQGNESNLEQQQQQPPPSTTSRTPFTNLSQVDADLALARTLQEQERAYMMLRMGNEGSEYGSWEAGSYLHDDDDDDFGDPHDHTEADDDDDDDDDEDDDGDEFNFNGTDVDDDDDDDEEDAFDVHAHSDVVDVGEDNSPSVEFDPEVYSSDEAYARALQDAEEREMAARLLALAGINDRQVDEDSEDDEDHGGNSQDAWEDVDPDELSYEELLALGEVVGTESRGLSADTIASLPSVNYKTGSSQSGSNDSCVICRLDYEDGETLTLLSCKHSYHSDCINNWLKINKVCPVCSTEVSTSGHS